MRAASYDLNNGLSVTKMFESNRLNDPTYDPKYDLTVTQEAMNNPEYHDDCVEKFIQILKMTTQAFEINIYSKDMI